MTPPRTHRDEAVRDQDGGAVLLNDLPADWPMGPVLVVADPPDGLWPGPEGTWFGTLASVPEDWEWWDHTEASPSKKAYNARGSERGRVVQCRPVPVPEPATVRVEALDAIAQRRKMKRGGVVHTADKLTRNRSSLSGVSVWSRGGVWLADPDDDGMVVVLADPAPADGPRAAWRTPAAVTSAGPAHVVTAGPYVTDPADTPSDECGTCHGQGIVPVTGNGGDGFDKCWDCRPANTPSDTEAPRLCRNCLARHRSDTDNTLCDRYEAYAMDAEGYTPAPSVVSSAGSPDTGRWTWTGDGEPILVLRGVEYHLHGHLSPPLRDALVALVRRDRPQPTAEQVLDRVEDEIPADLLPYHDHERLDLIRAVLAAVDACRTEGTGE